MEKTIEKISKYRDALMGVAILWVMLHHSGLNLPNPFFVVKRSGYCGVDIFMFVSGLGCAYSLHKNNDVLTFYKRRIKRIFPMYLPILAVFLAMNSTAQSAAEWARDILGNITGFSFWAMEGTRFNWYLVAIPVFYFITPIIFDCLKRYRSYGLTMLLILSFVAGFCFARTEDVAIAVYRLPIYVLGVAAGVYMVTSDAGAKGTNGIAVRIAAYAGGCIGLVLLALMHRYKDVIPVDYYNVFWPCILISIGLMCLLSRIFEGIEKSKAGKAIVQAFAFLGKLSLELYLIHIVFFGKIGMWIEGVYDKENPLPFSFKNILIWLMACIVTIVAAYAYRKGINTLAELASKRMEGSKA